MVNKYLNRNIEWALAPLAKECLDDLVSLGIDRDLALSVMEQLLPDTTLYDLKDEVPNE